VLKIIEQVDKLDYAQKVELLDALKRAIAEELAKKDNDPDCCPHCGSPKFVKKGHGKDGRQRWLCRGCAQSFSARSAGLIAHSKLSPAVWMAFAECMTDALSLRETASRCKVSLPTAWFMRMRVCEAMSYRVGELRVGTFHVDETYLVKSLSGNHRRSSWYSMPRKAHRNGQDGRKGNYSKTKERVCVLCGINELGDSFCELSNDGAPAKIDMFLVLEDKIPRGSRFVTDGHLSYPDDMDGIGHQSIDLKDPLSGDIAMVNALHSRLKGFLHSFHGISTRRLQRYLDWFVYRDQFRQSDVDKRKLLYSHEINGRYIKTRALTYLEARPFQPYWDRRAFLEMTRHMSILV
jgi:transposase-like protein